MKYKVVKYEASPLDFHKCIDENGENHQIDLFVNGDLSKDITCEELVGKTVNIERLAPHIELAFGVKILGE